MRFQVKSTMKKGHPGPPSTPKPSTSSSSTPKPSGGSNPQSGPRFSPSSSSSSIGLKFKPQGNLRK